MKINNRKGLSAFTLIELMAVITIIIILAGLVVAGLGFVNERQAREKGRVQIALLGKGLESYKLDMGAYPVSRNNNSETNTAGNGNSSDCLYEALFYEGYDYNQKGSPANWDLATSIYIADLDPKVSKQGWVATVQATASMPPTTTVMDPWSNEYRYRSAKNATGGTNSATINPDFDLWSAGKDGRTSPSSPSAKENKDDIKNF